MATSVSNVKTYLSEIKELTEGLLDNYLPAENKPPERLHVAMRYSVTAGGKRLRPILAYTAYRYCDGSLDGEDLPIHKAMAALELVHTYSLIHDDLPCMDDDDLRRGQPTCHKKFDEATAVLAGDALHDIAFILLAQAGSNEAVYELSNAIGTEGMIGGQMADVLAEGQELTKEQIINIHNRKTGALIAASVKIGAILAGADDKQLAKLSLFGSKIGLAFQIIDDILDVEGDQELLGKKVGSDTDNEKATYPKVVGLQQAKLDAEELIDQAIGLFDEGDENCLKLLARYISQRNM